jgi:hypothetical protein
MSNPTEPQTYYNDPAYSIYRGNDLSDQFALPGPATKPRHRNLKTVWLIANAFLIAWLPACAAAATFVVNSRLDLPDSFSPDNICDVTNNPTTNPPIPPSNICTLRAAIEQANFTPGFNEIDVMVTLIQPATPLPSINKPVKLVTGMTTKVVLDGYLLPAGSGGLAITGGGSTVQGFSIIRFKGTGIELRSSSNRIIGNLIGLTPSGTSGPNETGIFIVNGSGNIIGDSGANHGNVISNNVQEGISIQGGADNTIQNNLIGINEAGHAAMGNGSAGIYLRDSSTNLIGGGSVAERNVISSNAGGVWIDGGAKNKVLGNYIGTDKTGANNLGNKGTGVLVRNSAENLIGQASPGPAVTTSGMRLPTSGLPPGNVVSNNEGVGVDISGSTSTGNHIEGNFIGTDATGRVGRGNAYDGVYIDNAPQNIVGSATAGAGNLISFNGQVGVQIHDTLARQNSIQGNWIGVDLSGRTALGNSSIGVYINSAPATLVGGTTDPERNVISGNGWSGKFSGVYIDGAPATNNRIQGNYIGLSADGKVALGNWGDGVTIVDAPLNLVGGIQAPTSNFNPRNVIAGNSSAGVAISGKDAHDNQVEGNYIGTDITGKTLPLASVAGSNVQSVGVWIQDAPRSKVGGGTDAYRNLISGHAKSGVIVQGNDATSTHIEGNYIGTDITGTQALGNGEAGVFFLHAPGNFLGGSTVKPGDPPGNLISGNNSNPGWKGGAIQIQGDGAVGNEVKGNLIGTQQDGVSPLANFFDGIFITIDPVSGKIAAQTKIGGPKREDGNVIAFNGRDGVDIDKAMNGSDSVGNSILSNLIYSNKKLGIDLGAKGVPRRNWIRAHAGTFPPAQSSGPNLSQQSPILYLPPAGGVGTLDSVPNATFTLQFFSSPQGDVSGYGQGKTLLATASGINTSVTTDADGFADFRVPYPNGGEVLSATATDPQGNTSEFAKLCCMNNPDPALVGNINWVIKSASTVPQATLVSSSISQPIVPLKFEGGDVLNLHIHVAKTNGTQDDDLSRAFVTVMVRNLDWKTGASGNPAMISTESQPLTASALPAGSGVAGAADVFIDSDKILKALAVGENKNFVEAIVRICYRGRTLELHSDNVLHVLLERTVVFLPGVLGSEIWVNDPSWFTLPAPFNSSSERLAYPVPIGLVSVPGYTDWKKYQATYLALQYAPSRMKLFTHVDLGNVFPFSVIPLTGAVTAKTVYDVQTPLQRAVDDQLPKLQIQGQRVPYYRLQTWPYDWRQKLDDHVAALKTGGCLPAGASAPPASPPAKCFGADAEYAAPPTIEQIVQNAQTTSRFMDDRVTLVGHSTGGLVIRSALNDPAFRSLVDRAYFINTPFLGAPKAYYASMTGDMVKELIDPGVLVQLASSMPIVYYLSPMAGYIDPHSKDANKKLPDVVMGYPRVGGMNFDKRPAGTSSSSYMDKAIQAYTGAASTWSAGLAAEADNFQMQMFASKPAMGWQNTGVFWSQGYSTPAPAIVRRKATPVLAGEAGNGKTVGDGTVPSSSQVGGLPDPVPGAPPKYVLVPNTSQASVHDQAANQRFVWDNIVEELETPFLASFDGYTPLPPTLASPTVHPLGLTIRQKEAIGEAEMDRAAGLFGYENILAATSAATPRQGFDALYCDGKKLPLVTDPVYFACDGTLVIGEAKAGYTGKELDDIMAKGYGYRQGTIEWAHKAADFVVKRGGTKVDAVKQFLDALANGQPISMQVFHVDFKTTAGGAGLIKHYTSAGINPP